MQLWWSSTKCAEINTYFSSEVLEDGSTVHSRRGSDTTVAGCTSFQVSVDTTHWELQGECKKKTNSQRELQQATNICNNDDEIVQVLMDIYL